VSGRVVDGEGVPVSGATLVFESRRDEALRRAASGTSRATTDEAGEYRRDDLPAGWISVHASSAGLASGQREVELVDGRETPSVDFVLQRSAATELRLVPEAGESTPQYVLTLRTVQGRVVDASFTQPDRNGIVTLEGVPPGDHLFQVIDPGEPPIEVAVSAPTDAPVLVRLPRTLAVQFAFPALEASSARSLMKLVDANGRTLLHPPDGGLATMQEELLLDAAHRELRLVPGRWTVQVRTVDGSYSATESFDLEEGSQTVVVQ
jgi:hypothetical protein